MASWSVVPLFDRTEDKGSMLLKLVDRDERTRKRYEEIVAAGVKIHSLIQVLTQPHSGTNTASFRY